MKKSCCIIMLVLLLVLSACSSATPGAQGADASTAQADAIPAITAEPTPTPVPAPKEQHGTPNAVIFDQGGSRLTVESYSFVENEKLEMEVSSVMSSGEDGQFYINLASINGWTLESGEISPQTVTAANQTIAFDLSASPAIRLMQIQQINQVTFSIAGYIHSSFIGDVSLESTLDLSLDTEPGYVQPDIDVSEYLIQNDNFSVASLGYSQEQRELYVYYCYQPPERKSMSAEYYYFSSVLNGIRGETERMRLEGTQKQGILRLSFSEQMTLMNMQAIEKLDISIDDVIYPVLGAEISPPTSYDALPLLYQDESVRVYFAKWGTNDSGDKMPKPIFLLQSLTQHYFYRVNQAVLETKEAGKRHTYEASKNTRYSSNLPSVAPQYAMLCDMGDYCYYKNPKTRSWQDQVYLRPPAIDTVELSFDLQRYLFAEPEALGYAIWENFYVPQKWLTEEAFQKDKTVQAILEEYRTNGFMISSPGDKKEAALLKGLGQRSLNDGTIVSDLMYERVGDQEGYLVKSNGIVVSDTVKIRCSLNEELKELLPKVYTANSVEPFYTSDYVTIYYSGSEPCTSSRGNIKTTRLLFDVRMDDGATPVFIWFRCRADMNSPRAGRGRDFGKSAEYGVETTLVDTDANGTESTIDVSKGVDSLYVQIGIYEVGYGEFLAESDQVLVKLR